MGHIERHLNKTDKVLIDRLLKDWKVYSGLLLKDFSSDILKRANHLKDGRNVLILEFDEIVGYGYNRRFEKIQTKYIRAVVEKQEEEIEIITAYPELEKGEKNGERYEFDNDFGGEIGKFFLYFVRKNYITRYCYSKNPQVRVYVKDFVFKISKNTVTILKNGKIVSTDILYPKSEREFENIINRLVA